MIDELDAVRDALDTIEAPAMGLGRLEQRRTSHTRKVRIGTGLALAAAVGVTALVAANTMRGDDQQQPADNLEGGALRRPGEVLVVAGDEELQAIYAKVPDEPDLRVLVKLDALKAGATPGLTPITRAAWSTDGDRMAFELLAVSFTGPGCSSAAGLWMLDTAGPRQLTQSCSHEMDNPHDDPWTWVRGTNTIALADNQLDPDDEAPRRAALDLIDTVTGERRTIATVDGSIDALAQTADASTLYWITRTEEGPGDLNVTSLDDLTTTRITSLDTEFWWIALSPDESRLALAGKALRIMTTKGDVVADAPINVGVGVPMWSPDGGSLAWVTYPITGESVSYEVNVWATQRPLSDPGAVTVIYSGQDYGDSLRWSPDGSRIALLASVGEWRSVDVITHESATISADTAASWLGGSVGFP